MKNFKKLLIQIAHLPAEEQGRLLDEHFETWKGNEKQLDDVLVIGFRAP